MRSARVLAVVLSAALFVAAESEGQVPSPTGDIFGSVLDADGNFVAGVAVTLTGPGAAQTAITDGRGDFHFLDLSPGDYSVALEGAGFQSVRRDVSVTLGKNSVLSFSLPVAGVTERVTVVPDSASLDSRKVQTGATFGETELLNIPTTRDPWAFVRQVPGVLVANMNAGRGRRPRQPAFVGKGSNPDQNRYNLNGVAISQGGVSPLYYDFDSFDSIEVATGGSDPSLATPGVTIDLVTKRGTNQLRGSARGLYTGGAGWDYGIEAGGPVWKDRLWVWGAASSNAFLGRSFLAAGEPVDNRETLKHWNAKLNAELFPANTLTLSGTQFDRVGLGLGAGGDRSLPTTWTNTFDSQVFNIADSHVLSPKLFASLSLSYVRAKPANTPLGGLEEQADLDEANIWQHSFTSWRVRDTQHQVGWNTSAFFNTGGLRHELKFGFGYRHARLDSSSSWPGDMLVGYAPFDAAAITRPQIVNSEVNSYDVFVGDTIRTGNLTVNVGARFDAQQGKNLPSAVPANPVFPEVLPAVQYGGDSGFSVTWHQVEPRVGATYALNDNRTLLRASYSRFADELNTSTVRSINAFPSIATIYYGWNDADGNGRVEPGEVNFAEPVCCPGGVDPDNPGSSVQVNQISESLKPPTTDEFIVGVERQIAPGFSGSLAYTYRIFRNLEFSPLIGTTRANYQYLGNATGTAVDADGFALSFSEPAYGLMECPDPCVGTLLQNRPDANRTYSGVELQLLKSLSHGWMARVSFAYNDWQQHIGPGAIVNPNNEPPGTNVSGPVVEGIINATWQFNVSGMVELPFGIAASANLFGRQGFPILYRVDVITRLPIFWNETLQIGPATRYRTPNVYQLDLQLQKAFRIGSAIMVIPQFTCLNLLDSHTVLQRDGFVGNYFTETQVFEAAPDVFNAVGETLSGRAFRGGVRITF